MRVLVVAATTAEVGPLVAGFRQTEQRGPRVTRYQASRHEIDLLVTGVGMVATSVWCARVLDRDSYDLALNLGVCGSFNASIEPGAVVHVVTDRISELGAEDGDAFLTIQQLDLLGESEFPFDRGRLVNAAPPANPSLEDLRAVDGITVNTAHGDEASIAAVTRRFAPDVESMEGAAFMYSCLIQGVPFAQVRAVSNRVERRNRSAWKMAESIANLTETARRLLELV